MPLEIIIIGAGIAGLCAAISLRQAGHSVKIYEKSTFATETGAAVALSPNGSLVLDVFGFSYDRARTRVMKIWESVHGDSLERISCQDFSDSEREYGAPLRAVHRVDLHKEFLRLACQEGDNPVTLHLGKKVETVWTDKGMVELQDGESDQADLIVACDGLHSVARNAVAGGASAVTSSGLSAFRTLIPTKKLKEVSSLQHLLAWKSPGSTILADTKDTTQERHLVWYDCQGGDVQNIAGIHPTRYGQENQDPKSALLEEFGHFHPEVVEVLKYSEEVKCWPLFIHQPLLSWIKGKVILIGDAAHPMLPFGGQGANQSIEDGGALGFLLVGVTDAAQIPERLAMFEKLRIKRVARTQTLSKTRVGREKDVEDELKQFADTEGGGKSSVPTTFPERVFHDSRYNIHRECQKLLQAQS